jgi:hypothetical protein
MSNNLEPGCLAVVIETITGAQVGAVVQCIKIIGEHSKYGTMWEVASKKQLVTEYGGMGNTAHSPAKWLRRIKPGELDKKTEKDKELAHE